MRPRLEAKRVAVTAEPDLRQVVALYKERVATLAELADAAEPFYLDVEPSVDLLLAHVTDTARPALAALKARLAAVAWERGALNDALKQVVAEHKLKLPQVAIPLRVLILAQPQTPAIDAVLAVLGRDRVLARMGRHV